MSTDKPLSSSGGKLTQEDIEREHHKIMSKITPEETPEETRKRYNDKLSHLVEDCNEDLDEIDRKAGQDYAIDQLQKSKERFNDAADDEIEKEENRQADKIALRTLQMLQEALAAYIEESSVSPPGGS